MRRAEGTNAGGVKGRRGPVMGAAGGEDWLRPPRPSLSVALLSDSTTACQQRSKLGEGPHGIAWSHRIQTQFRRTGKFQKTHIHVHRMAVQRAQQDHILGKGTDCYCALK
jgi:hypothetical protein